MRSFSSAVALIVALVALPGCGGDGVPMQRTYKVTGTIRLDGKPVAGLDVRFIPKDKTNFKLNETPLGRTDAEGRFALTTYYTGDGAPAGAYLVAIAYPDQVPELPEEADETAAAIAAAKAAKASKKDKGGLRFPAFYQVPQKSGLTAIVPESSVDLPPFELSSTAK